MGDRPRKNFRQRAGVKLQLRRVSFDFRRQIARANFIRLEIHQPDFLRQQHDQIRHALHDDKFVFQVRRRFFRR